MSFGYRPAGVFLEIIINQASEKFKEIDSHAANKIKIKDGVITGGSPSEVYKVADKRSNTWNTFKTDGTLSKIGSKGNLNLKAMITSGKKR